MRRGEKSSSISNKHFIFISVDKFDFHWDKRRNIDVNFSNLELISRFELESVTLGESRENIRWNNNNEAEC